VLQGHCRVKWIKASRCAEEQTDQTDQDSGLSAERIEDKTGRQAAGECIFMQETRNQLHTKSTAVVREVLAQIPPGTRV
jgi:hypothetical protein